LDIIASYPVSTVELGVQSMDDQVLALCRRGHTSRDTTKAVSRLKEMGMAIGLQIMVGLPGDDEAGCIETAQRVADLAPDFVRIYPTIVLESSPLAEWHRQGIFEPLGLDQSVTLVKKLYLHFRNNRIPVIRMGLAPSDDFDAAAEIVAGPFHPAFGHLVYSEIFLDRVCRIIRSRKTVPDRLLVHVHPRSVSRFRGFRNRNIKQLKNRFNIRSIDVVPDPGLDIESVMIDGITISKQ
jgi:histone acetyltransferase (RNA polymerase elongator complex component)